MLLFLLLPVIISSQSDNNKIYDPTLRLKYEFHPEKEINLTQANPEYYDDDEEDHFYRPYSINEIWKKNQHNDLLKRSPTMRFEPL